MNDTELRQKVIDELELEPSIDSADIGVLVENGVVTLIGHVPLYGQKLAAERMAWCVNGVKEIVQNITVRNTGEPTSDEEIEERALGILNLDGTLPKDAVRLAVNKGWLTLEGQMNWQFQRNNVEKDLRHLIGVTGITNNITIRPAAQVSAVKQCIEDALKRHAEIEAKQIRVDVKDGSIVTLEGRVSTWTERVAVECAAWSAPGVTSVVDHLAMPRAQRPIIISVVRDLSGE